MVNYRLEYTYANHHKKVRKIKLFLIRAMRAVAAN